MNSKSFVFLLLALFGSSVYAGDPRCSPQGYIGSAITGAIAGVLIGDSGRAAGRGAGAMVGVQAVTCATQSVRRVTTYASGDYGNQGGYYGGGNGGCSGNGCGGSGGPYNGPNGGNNYGYHGSPNDDYYDSGRYTYRPRTYRQSPRVDYRDAAAPYCQQGRHFNTWTGRWEWSAACR